MFMPPPLLLVHHRHQLLLVGVINIDLLGLMNFDVLHLLGLMGFWLDLLDQDLLVQFLLVGVNIDHLVGVNLDLPFHKSGPKASVIFSIPIIVEQNEH